MPKKTVEHLSPAALKKAIDDQFGPGTMLFGNDPLFEIERIPSGIATLDVLMDGGFPRGRHIELYGPPSVGKTYTCYCLIANAQAMGLNCAFIDVEGTYDSVRAVDLGIDTKALALHRQKHGAQVVDFMESLLRTDQFDVIVLDSIAALLPLSEYENSMEAGSMGMEQAKLMSKALRKLTTADRNRKTVKAYINQTRDSMSMFQKAVTSGGRAMGFYASMRLEFAQGERMKEKRPAIDPSKGDEKSTEQVVGHRVLVRLSKEKTGANPEGTTTTFVFNYDLATHDRIEDLIYLGRRFGVVCKQGDYWWVDGFEDERQHGRTRFVRWLRENVAVAEELEEQIMEGETEEADGE